ncbi:MAG: PIN domain nuclease [Elusimicrobia bacterium CG08_land_8_20_14_0_20_59_10]|nr:MAG: PIN domain nuclease [Elusimicrobia bacterium CG08_land_8_20_14_0_20_59_10]
MIVWIFRVVALLGTPVLTWLTISKDLKGVAFGVLIGLVIIGVEYVFENVSLFSLIIGIIGGVAGIIVSKLLDYTVFQIDNDVFSAMWLKYNIIIRYALALLGMIVSIRKIPEIDDLDKNILSLGRRSGKNMKVLDISAILDGRVLDICDTHFITGGMITPRFVVQELHTLAESGEPTNKAKGRRGLDILARLQESRDIPFRVIDREIKDMSDNQMKLVTIARELGASIVTTDFTINKLAALENVTVLNINDLTIALKPVVLPGEETQVFVMKEGKEKEQGVGYLDDGTMIVIEDGRDYIGKKVDATVQSILQTSQGRIIFTRVKGRAAQDGPKQP